jgi:GTP pyrophosphokinase
MTASPATTEPRPASGSNRRALDAEELQDVEARLDAVFRELRASEPGVDLTLPRRAFEIALRAHFDQRRRSGEPYLIHPLRVALTIARMGLGPVSVAAGLMHDTVEDSNITVYELTEAFGREVAQLVDGVTKLGKVPYLSRKENQAESFRKMLVAMSQDIRVLLVKLADRLDNMQTLDHMPAKSQERIARETMDIFVPLAGRLGVDWLRRELRDLAFRYLQPADFKAVFDRMEALREAHPDFVDRTLDRLRQAFSEDAGEEGGSAAAGVTWREDVFGPVELRASMRPVYAVQQRALETGRELEQVSDIVTYQVITRTQDGCYAALGQVHAAFQPAPGRFRDYIALPRPNRYQALHTVVTDRGSVRMEVQIRSESMDATAERGIVVDLRRGREGEASKLQWLSALVDWQGEVSDPQEFIEAVKADLFADEVYAFTPQGELRTFPRGSTPIDFAFAIHTDVGMHASGARVNGQIVPLRYRLRQGDTVEIITDANVWPRHEWLEMCTSSRARAKIKHHLRQLDRARLEETGRSLLEQELESTPHTLEELAELAAEPERLEKYGVSAERGFHGLLEAVGDGSIGALDVVDLTFPDAREDSASVSLISRVLRRVPGLKRGPLRPPRAGEGTAGSPILLDRERILGGVGMVQLAPCCSPLPGDPAIGFLAPGRGLVVHVEGCPEVTEQLDKRRVFVAWEPGLELDRPVTLEVRTGDTVGLLAEMSRAFSAHGVNIKRANCRAGDDGREFALNTFHATVRSLAQLESLMLVLKDIHGVFGVERVLGHRASDE